MSLTAPIKGRDVALFVQKLVGTPGVLTYVQVSCIGDVSLDIDTETDEASCSASGLWKDFIPGQNSWTASANLTAREIDPAEADANVSVAEFVGFQIAQTPLLIRFTLSDDIRYSGQVIITKNGFKGQLKGAATSGVSFQGTGPLVAVV